MSPPMALCSECHASEARAVVRLNHDEEMGPMRGMRGTLDAELEGWSSWDDQRTSGLHCDDGSNER